MGHDNAATPNGRGTRRPQVIVAEDDHEMRRLLVSSLLRDGYVVVEAADGPALLDAVRRFLQRGEAPAAVVSDIHMPGLDGLQVLSRLRGAQSHVPVILITAFGSEEVAEEGARLGAVRVFSKPFDLDHLRTEVARVVGLTAA